MRIVKTFYLVGLILLAGNVAAQLQSIDLDNLDAFRQPGTNWVIASDITTDYTGELKTRQVNGVGVVMNYHTPKNESHLITKQEWGDMELEFEFMMFKNSNSGVYLQGRYEVQLYDSWKKIDPTWYDVGAIYSRYDNGYSYEGTQPSMNVAKAPGLWQKLQIRFRAPRFNDKGEKIQNARFESVRLNGVTIIREVDVSGCTRACIFPEERKTGPLVFQGDHGPVAFRNIRYGNLVPAPPPPQKADIWNRDSHFWKTAVNPVVVRPSAKSEIIRTFLKYKDTTLTHTLSVGAINELNYSYDVKQGNIFQIWRGRFLDVTAAWWDRGWLQLGVPMGAVIVLPNAPVAAKLKLKDDVWPDSLAFREIRNEGYVLNKSRQPTFRHTYKSMKISDEIKNLESSDGLGRIITISGNIDDTYCRIAVGEKIELINKNLYVVDDKSFYIRFDKNYNQFVRKQGEKYEILVKYKTPISYNIIW